MFPSSEGSWDAGCSNLRLHGHSSCQLALSWDAKTRQNQEEKKNFHVFWGEDPIWEFLAELWLPLQHLGWWWVRWQICPLEGADGQHVA